jgi:hypothetical protein
MKTISERALCANNNLSFRHFLAWFVTGVECKVTASATASDALFPIRHTTTPLVRQNSVRIRTPYGARGLSQEKSQFSAAVSGENQPDMTRMYRTP